MLSMFFAAAMIVSYYGAVVPNEPLSVGQKLELAGVVCDTREQAESIVRAHQEGGLDAGKAQFEKLRHTFKDFQPVCAYRGNWGVQVLAQLQEFSGLEAGDGRSGSLFLLEVDLMPGEAIMLSPVGVKRRVAEGAR